MQKMMKLTAKNREGVGSNVARRLRRDGWVPALMNDEKGAPHALQVNRHDFGLILHQHIGENVMLDLDVEGKGSCKVLVKEVQHHPVTNEILHADFLEISMTRKMRVNIPIVLAGEPVGVSQEGGILDFVMRTVEVDCLPGDLVESISLDVSAMKIGDALFVRDLKVDPKLTIVTPKDVAVATVSPPPAEEEVAVEAAVEGALPAEPEVITARKPKEGEEGEAAAEGDAKAPAKGGDKAAKPAAGAKPAGKDAAAKPGDAKAPAAGAKPAPGKAPPAKK